MPEQKKTRLCCGMIDLAFCEHMGPFKLLADNPLSHSASLINLSSPFFFTKIFHKPDLCPLMPGNEITFDKNKKKINMMYIFRL